jgi:hypothetical protein
LVIGQFPPTFIILGFLYVCPRINSENLIDSTCNHNLDTLIYIYMVSYYVNLFLPHSLNKLTPKSLRQEEMPSYTGVQAIMNSANANPKDAGAQVM